MNRRLFFRSLLGAPAIATAKPNMVQLDTTDDHAFQCRAIAAYEVDPSKTYAVFVDPAMIDIEALAERFPAPGTIIAIQRVSR